MLSPFDIDPARVAALWHGGQASALYSLSCGFIPDDPRDLESEVAGNLRWARNDPSPEITPEDVRELEVLHDWSVALSDVWQVGAEAGHDARDNGAADDYPHGDDLPDGAFALARWDGESFVTRETAARIYRCGWETGYAGD